MQAPEKNINNAIQSVMNKQAEEQRRKREQEVKERQLKEQFWMDYDLFMMKHVMPALDHIAKQTVSSGNRFDSPTVYVPEGRQGCVYEIEIGQEKYRLAFSPNIHKKAIDIELVNKKIEWILDSPMPNLQEILYDEMTKQ